jgi:hypothetical protein
MEEKYNDTTDSNKNECKTCEDGKYSNTETGNICVICSSGKEPNSNKNMRRWEI